MRKTVGLVENQRPLRLDANSVTGPRETRGCEPKERRVGRVQAAHNTYAPAPLLHARDERPQDIRQAVSRSGGVQFDPEGGADPNYHLVRVRALLGRANLVESQ